MANKKITELTDLPSPAGADILAIVDDVAGTATTKKVSATNLMTLAPVQTVAGQTGTVTLSNTDISGLGTAATANTGTSANNVVQLDGTAKLPAVDGSQLTGISVDVDTPITNALRGTTNPHIGVYPNQSFKVIDNPDKSVMVIADENGNLEFLVNSDSAKLFLNKPSLREEITTGVSVKEDSIEPDIEITTTSGTYSLITGDSDALGANGLPARQGFNVPDIGVNQAPLLISGGSIA